MKIRTMRSFCNNNKEANKLKFIAIVSILAASVIGCFFTVGWLHVKIQALGLASGVILETGYMHVLPD